MPLYKVGDWVRFIGTPSAFAGQIIELRGKLGPGGAEVYRIKFARTLHLDAWEDQLEPTSGGE